MMDKFDILEKTLYPEVEANVAQRVAQEAIAAGRQLARELSDLGVRMRFAAQQIEVQEQDTLNLRRQLCEERLERHKLKVFLREALRHWIQNSRHVEDAVAVWRMSRQAGLGQ